MQFTESLVSEKSAARVDFNANTRRETRNYRVHTNNVVFVSRRVYGGFSYNIFEQYDARFQRKKKKENARLVFAQATTNKIQKPVGTWSFDDRILSTDISVDGKSSFGIKNTFEIYRKKKIVNKPFAFFTTLLFTGPITFLCHSFMDKGVECDFVLTR